MLRAFVALTTSATVLATPAIAAATPTTLALGGTGRIFEGSNPVPPLNVNGMLSGKYATDETRILDYPAAIIGMPQSIEKGAQMLSAAIAETPGEKQAFGVSQGAIVLSETKKKIMAMPEAQRPAPSQLEFVHVGDPSRPNGGALRIFNYQQPPETPYDTTYITREYDGFADFPDYPLNFVATFNAAMGIIYIHPNYPTLPADIPAENITTTVNSLGGKTTDILIPTKHLPMLQPLRDLGVDERLVSEIEKPLKQLVDAGYKRNHDDDESDEPEDDKPAKVTAERKSQSIKYRSDEKKDRDDDKDDQADKEDADKAESDGEREKDSAESAKADQASDG